MENEKVLFIIVKSLRESNDSKYIGNKYFNDPKMPEDSQFAYNYLR